MVGPDGAGTAGSAASPSSQSAVLVLGRRAPAPQWQESVAGWLYGVAYRVALKARATAARRQVHEGRVGPRLAADPLADITLRELQGVLDEELDRLPEKYRLPI